MKKRSEKSYDYSPIALRGLARHKMPPPSFRMKDKKKDGNKNACRSKEHWYNNNMTATEMQPQFDRARNGSLFDRGSADAYYQRAYAPHWYPEGTYKGARVENLTSEETEEYRKGFQYQESTGEYKQY